MQGALVVICDTPPSGDTPQRRMAGMDTETTQEPVVAPAAVETPPAMDTPPAKQPATDWEARLKAETAAREKAENFARQQEGRIRKAEQDAAMAKARTDAILAGKITNTADADAFDAEQRQTAATSAVQTVSASFTSVLHERGLNVEDDAFTAAHELWLDAKDEANVNPARAQRLLERSQREFDKAIRAIAARKAAPEAKAPEPEKPDPKQAAAAALKERTKALEGIPAGTAASGLSDQALVNMVGRGETVTQAQLIKAKSLMDKGVYPKR